MDRAMNEYERESERRLLAVREQARRLVPHGAPIVAVASMRTMHGVTALNGEVLPLVLASPAFTQAQFGAYSTMENPWVLVVDGVLCGDHIPDLLPSLEQAVAKTAQIVIAAADFDQAMLAMLVVNAQRGTVGVAALALADPADLAPLRRLAELANAKASVVQGARLHVGSLGSLPELLMTTRETVVVGAAGAQPLALIHAGGETSDAARAAAAVLCGMM